MMSNSEARKKRMKLFRQQRKDVTEQRNTAPFSTHIRMTKTKKDTLEKEYEKYKKHYEND